jgi:hypothetical protein
MGIHECDGHLSSIYRIDWTATERTWPAPMIADSSSNQTIGVILDFMRHPLIGFVCRQTVMHTVYNKRGEKASGAPPEPPLFAAASFLARRVAGKGNPPYYFFSN